MLFLCYNSCDMIVILLTINIRVLGGRCWRLNTYAIYQVHEISFLGIRLAWYEGGNRGRGTMWNALIG